MEVFGSFESGGLVKVGPTWTAKIRYVDQRRCGMLCERAGRKGNRVCDVLSSLHGRSTDIGSCRAPPACAGSKFLEHHPIHSLKSLPTPLSIPVKGKADT